jgi:hypothetical protein
LLHQFLHAPGRADHHLRRVRLQRGQLRFQRNAAGEHRQLEVGDAGGELAQLLADLVGQFAGGAQHQRLRARDTPGSRPCSRPSPKAAVLPLPVGACAIRSRPSRIGGSACAWIGVRVV